jgi:hypothetical protein
LKRLACLLIFAAFWPCLLQAQHKTALRGNVTDSSGSPLPSVTVKAFSATDSTTGVTDDNGTFSLQLVIKDSVRLVVSAVGYQGYDRKKKWPAAESALSWGTLSLTPDASVLGEIIVTSVNPITVKEDTIEYKASAYKVREGAPIEDAIKKMPDITVDKDGQITAQGKQVTRVRVNGKDFFGGDVQTATRNLPADIVDNIQIIDDYGDQANLTGIKSGEPEKILNINIRKDRNRGLFGNATAAGGTEGRFTGGISANRFRDEQQLSLLASINNTNTPTFNFGGGGRGGGMRGMNFNTGGGFGGGITTMRSAGLNFRDQWGKQLSVYGSYSFTSSSSRNESTSFSQDINPLNIRSTNRSSNSESSSLNQRLTLNAEYRPDTMTFIKVSPYFSHSKSEQEGRSQSLIQRPLYQTLQNSRNANESSSINTGGNFSYSRRFKNKARSLSISGEFNYSYRNQDQEQHNRYQNADSTYVPVLETDTIQQQSINLHNVNTQTNLRASYTQPLRTRLVLELSYDWNRSVTRNDRTVIDNDPFTNIKAFNPDQSNYFDYSFITNRIGTSLKGSGIKFNYVAGVTLQPILLEGESVGKEIRTRYSNFNVIPVARFVYNFSRSNTLTATYGGQARQPGFMQLQPVADSSNLNNIVIGNPDLEAEQNNRFTLQYNKFDSKSGNSLFANLSFDQTSNKIVSNRFNSPNGTGRTTTYLNADGFYMLSGNASCTRPFNKRKYTTGVSVNGQYNNNISFTDNLRNRGNNWSVRPSANFRVDLENIIDASLNVSYSVSQTTTRYTAFTNVTKARTLNLGLNGRNYFFKDFTLGYDVTQVFNYGFSRNVNSNPIVVNVYTEYRFLKNKIATVRLQGFDLFNQNTGISRDVSETTIIESRSLRLARYFLLSLNIRLQKFTGGNNRQRNGSNESPRGSGENRRNGGGGFDGGGRSAR